MKLSIGIVGLPNVGKSTLFNSLTKNKVEAQNYPFCTIDPNVGVVAVPDDRLQKLSETVKAQKILPAVVEFIDIAGLVRNAHQGEGLGNQFLANIRECDAIAEVVRVFEDSNVLHVEGQVNPTSDMETIGIELALADLQTVSKAIERTQKIGKTNPKGIEFDMGVLNKAKTALENGKPVRHLKLDEKEKAVLKPLNLMTAKPHIYIFNVKEEQLANPNIPLIDEDYVVISAKLEQDLQDLDPEEQKEYLNELGIEGTGLDRLIRKTYETLGLITYFTAGEKEVHAWTIKKGWTAPQAAGEIHTDFEKGFISADVVSAEDLIALGWVGAREKGRVRAEGRDYVAKDGDVMVFKFNVSK